MGRGIAYGFQFFSYGFLVMFPLIAGEREQFGPEVHAQGEEAFELYDALDSLATEREIDELIGQYF